MRLSKREQPLFAGVPLIDLRIVVQASLFWLSFVVALSGAMSPGPVLTYVVYRCIHGKRPAYLESALIILGHALLEGVLIAVLLVGLASMIQIPAVLQGIGLVGGGLLIFFGQDLVRSVAKGQVDVSFLVQGDDPAPERSRPNLPENPVLGGIVISMSNPYWWLWWATIGLAFMAQYNVTIVEPANLVVFFFGHELGDLAWYLLVGVIIHLGRNLLTRRVYSGLLVTCGFFMMGFGLYLALSPLLSL
jgi:threonine/homoserine/homoserine lactone efflux protein